MLGTQQRTMNLVQVRTDKSVFAKLFRCVKRGHSADCNVTCHAVGGRGRESDRRRGGRSRRRRGAGRAQGFPQPTRVGAALHRGDFPNGWGRVSASTFVSFS